MRAIHNIHACMHTYIHTCIHTSTQPDFTKLEFKVGVLTKTWAHPDSEKLFCEEIDVGEVYMYVCVYVYIHVCEHASKKWAHPDSEKLFCEEIEVGEVYMYVCIYTCMHYTHLKLGHILMYLISV